MYELLETLKTIWFSQQLLANTHLFNVNGNKLIVIIYENINLFVTFLVQIIQNQNPTFLNTLSHIRTPKNREHFLVHLSITYEYAQLQNKNRKQHLHTFMATLAYFPCI